MRLECPLYDAIETALEPDLWLVDLSASGWGWSTLGSSTNHESREVLKMRRWGLCFFFFLINVPGIILCAIFQSYLWNSCFICQAYAHANKLFLEAVAGMYEEGDIVLVHDYDLMLLPALLRKRFPDITCGFFLHCPFPSTGKWKQQPIAEDFLGKDVDSLHSSALVLAPHAEAAISSRCQ